MKKKILIALCLFGLVKANAQESSNNSSNASFGIKGGVNFTNLYVDNVDDTNMLTGFNAGVFVELPLAQDIAIVPEINFSRKGSEVQTSVLTQTYYSKFKLNYLEVPVLLKFNIVPNFNLHAGPYAAYLLDAKRETVDQNGNNVLTLNYNTDDFNKLDFGISAGLGFDFNNFGIGARYNHGLSQIDKNNNANGAKNSAWNLYLALKF